MYFLVESDDDSWIIRLDEEQLKELITSMVDVFHNYKPELVSGDLEEPLGDVVKQMNMIMETKPY